MVVNNQKGISIISALLTLLIIGTIISLTSKVVPAYIKDRGISKVLSSQQGQPQSYTTSISDIKKQLKKPFDNADIQLDKNAIQIRKEGSSLAAKIIYEHRVHLVYNISLILSFEHNWKSIPK